MTGIEIAFATPKDVITQVPSSEEAPNDPEIVWIATFVIVESSICIKVAIASAIVTKIRVLPFSGGSTDDEHAIIVPRFAQ